MELNEDTRLREVLREWQVPGAPSSLDERVLARRRSPWRFLLSGSIRVPIPVCVAVVAALIVIAVAVGRGQRPPAPEPARPAFNFHDFQPVQDAQVRVIRRQHAKQ